MDSVSIPTVELTIHNEEGVILLRQEVRQLARKLGVGLPQQAKITTALSEVSRKLLSEQYAITITIAVTKQRAPALQILCAAPEEQRTSEVLNLMNTLSSSASIRALVDEVNYKPDVGGLLLTIWVPVAGQGEARKG